MERDLLREIAAKYESGATTPALCVEYGLSKGGLLKLLRRQGVELRRQPLTPEQVEEAAVMYRDGLSIASIATPFGVSYNGVRQAPVGAGIERRPRGGSRLARSPTRLTREAVRQAAFTSRPETRQI